MAINEDAILRTFILSISAVATAIGDRIACPTLELSDGTLPAISYFAVGGTPVNSATVIQPQYQIDCWASTPLGARTLYQDLRDGMECKQMVTVGSDMLLSAYEVATPTPLKDPDTGYFRTLARFQFMMRTNS